jgi:hypothetical protein
MPSTKTKTSLSPGRRRLLELMQQINFGRIDGITVRDGEPLFDSSPRIVREIKFCGENGPRAELGIDDFALKAQVVELFEHLDGLVNGKIGSIEVKYGLPFRMSIEELVQA